MRRTSTWIPAFAGKTRLGNVRLSTVLPAALLDGAYGVPCYEPAPGRESIVEKGAIQWSTVS